MYNAVPLRSSANLPVLREEANSLHFVLKQESKTESYLFLLPITDSEHPQYGCPEDCSIIISQYLRSYFSGESYTDL